MFSASNLHKASIIGAQLLHPAQQQGKILPVLGNLRFKVVRKSLMAAPVGSNQADVLGIRGRSFVFLVKQPFFLQFFFQLFKSE